MSIDPELNYENHEDIEIPDLLPLERYILVKVSHNELEIFEAVAKGMLRQQLDKYPSICDDLYKLWQKLIRAYVQDSDAKSIEEHLNAIIGHAQLK